MRYLKTLFCLVLIVLLVANTASSVSLVASRAVLVAQGGSDLLFNRGADVRHPPASITKVLTAILALERGNLDAQVTFSQQAVSVGGSSLNARAGDTFTLRDLVYAAMLISANDASNAIAEHLAGSLGSFNEMMNERAIELGMRNSQFRNAHGMPEQGHFSTARDLALLGLHAHTVPLFTEIAGTERYVLSSGRVLHNQNRLLGEYWGVKGGKTGFTDEAGQCLLLIAERGGLVLVSVVLGSEGRNLWSDSEALLNFGFNNFTRQVLVSARQTLGLLEVPLAGEVLVVAKNELSRVVRTAVVRQAVPHIDLELQKSLWPPLKPGQVVGEAIVTADGAQLGRVELTVPSYVPLFTAARVSIVIGVMTLFFAVVKLRRRWRR
ncbi:MAG: D-alanyl-D-alanine carboxypeptidase [Thermaerobacter sp.]|nr:D-alanyl-D-alanine carboxypeptidase [Thermaerobacter sp.]